MRSHNAILSIFMLVSVVLANHTGENNRASFLDRTTDNASGENLISEYLTGATYNTGPFNFSTTTFVVPTVTGGTGQNAYLWTGFFDNTTFLQAGVVIDISGDNVIYQAESVWNSQVDRLDVSSFPVSPGDVISISINVNSDTSAAIIFENGDNTEVQDLSSDTPLSTQNVVWGVERYPASQGGGDLVGFDTVDFTNAEAYGPNDGIYALDAAVLITMVTHDGNPVAVPSVNGRSMTIVHQ